MTNRSREERLKKEVERLISDHPWSEEHLALIRAFLEGDMIEEESAQVARDFIDEYVRVLRGLAAVTPDLQKEVSQKLRAARLPLDQEFNEAVLHRFADDPAAAIKRIEARDAALSERNATNAKKPRVSRRDWWSDRIGDYVEHRPNAALECVKEYLLQIEGVSFQASKFRYVGQDQDHGVTIDPISSDSFRSKTNAAKKRYMA
jgi:hypothetical protein